jgi:hypothetical protein
MDDDVAGDLECAPLFPQLDLCIESELSKLGDSAVVLLPVHREIARTRRLDLGGGH